MISTSLTRVASIFILLCTSNTLLCPLEHEIFSFKIPLYYQDNLSYSIDIPRMAGCLKNETTISTLLQKICLATGIDKRDLHVRLVLARRNGVIEGKPHYDYYKYYTFERSHVSCNGRVIQINHDEEVLVHIPLPSNNINPSDHHCLIYHAPRTINLIHNTGQLELKIDDDAKRTLASYTQEHIANRELNFTCTHCNSDIPGTQPISRIACYKIDPSRWERCNMLHRPIFVDPKISHAGLNPQNFIPHFIPLIPQNYARPVVASSFANSLSTFISQAKSYLHLHRTPIIICTGVLLCCSAFRNRAYLSQVFRITRK